MRLPAHSRLASPRVSPGHNLRIPRWNRRELLAGTAGLAAWSLAGCGDSGDDSGTTQNGEDGDVETHEVEHHTGAAHIPTEPQRVVTLDTGAALQVALEVGAPLVGASVLQGDEVVPDYLPEPESEFEELGWFTEISIEQIGVLEPDLIIGHPASVESNEDTLNDLAPTVVYPNSAVGVDWRTGCRKVAEFLGRSEIEEELITEYEDRAAQFQQEWATVLDDIRVALVRFTTEEMRIITDSVIFGSTVLSDCGVRLTASSEVDDPEEETYLPVSLEEVGMLDDADVILWFGGGGGFEDDGDAAEVVQTYTESTLWQRLPAVEAGLVFEVSELTWWDGGSPSAAQACLDELEEHMPTVQEAAV